mmetsp:Transcript_55447/g.179814  ORF Transcript_55447/g.179814 Transcript_55447/m.179814 type:complete len:216 (-) Transcript_55447:909-1556(-)
MPSARAVSNNTPSGIPSSAPRPAEPPPPPAMSTGLPFTTIALDPPPPPPLAPVPDLPAQPTKSSTRSPGLIATCPNTRPPPPGVALLPPVPPLPAVTVTDMMELPVATNSLAGTGPHLVKSVAPAGKGADDVVAKVVVAAKAVVAAEAVMAVEAVVVSAKVVLAAGSGVVAELCIVGPQPNPSYSQHHIALLSDQTASQVATNATQSYCIGAGDG